MTYLLTKTDIAALRQGNDLCVHFNGTDDTQSSRPTGVRVIKRVGYADKEKNPFAQDQEHTIEAPVRIAGSGQSFTPLELSRVTAFAMIGLFHSQNTPESTIIKSLREGDDICFEFLPDNHTNGYVAAAGLHADVLLLRVYRGEGKNRKTLSFEIDSGISPNNQARMVRGAPVRASYIADAERCRNEIWSPPVKI